MATRIQGTYYSDEESNTFVVSVDDADYGGAAVDFVCHGLFFDWQSDDGDDVRNKTIFTSTCEIVVWIDSANLNNFVGNLAGAEEERFTVKITRGGNLYWAGLVQTEQVEIEDRPYNSGYEFLLRASDGIGRLKTIDYNNAGAAYTGKETVMAHIFNVLGKISSVITAYWGVSDIYLDSVIDWWEDSQVNAAATDPLTVTRFDHRAFIEIDENSNKTYKSAYEVLRLFCQQFNARFLLADGRYKLIQTNEYANTGTVTIRHFVKAGTYDSNTTSSSFAVYDKTWGDGGDYPASADFYGLAPGRFSFFPALDRVEIFYDHFSTRNLTPGAVWSDTQGASYQADDLDDNSGTVKLLISFGINYTVNFPTASDFVPCKPKFRLSISVNDGVTTYYLKRVVSTQSNGQAVEGPQSWTTSSTDYFEFYPKHVTINNFNQSDLKIFQTIALPTNGDLVLDMELNVLQALNGAIINSALYNVTWSTNNFYTEALLDGTPEGQYNRTKYLVTNTDATTNSAKVSQTVLLGDGPTGNTFGHLEVSDGATWTNSSAWRKGSSGAYDKTINELLAFEIIAGQITPVRRWNGQIVGDIEVFSTLVRDSDNYICAGARYDAGLDIWEGQWFVISRNPTPINVEDSESQIGDEVGNPPSSGGGGVPPTENPGVVDTGLAAPTYPDLAIAVSDALISTGDSVTDITVEAGNENELYFPDDGVYILNEATGESQLTIIDDSVSHITGDTTMTVDETTANYDFPPGSQLLMDPAEMAANITWGRRKFFRFSAVPYDTDLTTSSTFITLDPFFRPSHGTVQDVGYQLADFIYLRRTYIEIGQAVSASASVQYSFRILKGGATQIHPINFDGTTTRSSIGGFLTLLEDDIYTFELKRTDVSGLSSSKGLEIMLELVNKAFSPNDIDGLTVWLRADAQVYNDAGTTRAADGQTVQEWHDQSGNNNDATQTTAANKPTLALNAVNGWPAILFDGTNDRFDIGAVSDFVFLHDTGGTVFIVFQPGTAADPDDIYALISNSTTTTDVGFNISYDDQVATPANDQIITTVYNGTLGQTVVSNASDDVTPANEFTLITVVLDPDNGTTANRGYIYAENEDIVIQENAATDSSSSANATRVAQIGSNGVGGDPLSGYIAEILIYNTVLAATDRQKVLRYLNRKYSFSYSFVPSDISGLQLWLRSDLEVYNDAGATDAGDGDSIQEWHDQSGNNNDVTQTTAANKPTLETNVVNGKPVVRFDGTNDFLAAADALGFTDYPFTIIVVFGNQTSSDDGSLCSFYYSASMTEFQSVEARDDLSELRADSFNSSGSDANVSYSASSSYNIAVAVFASATDRKIYLNAGTPGTDTTSVTFSSNIDSFNVGRLRSSAPERYLQGDIAEVLIYNSALNEVNRQKIENYLASKYNITI